MKQTSLYCYALFVEATKLKDNGHGCSAVMLYWLSIEAFLNDYTERLKERPPSECQRQLSVSFVFPALDDSHISSWLRLEIFHNLLTHSKLACGKEPWQSAKLLHDIRNSIAHPRPTVQTIEGNELRFDANFKTGESHRKLFRRMNAAGLIEGFDEKNCMELDWYKLISEPSVSTWADQTCKSFLSYLSRLIPESTGQAEYVRMCTQMPWDRQWD